MRVADAGWQIDACSDACSVMTHTVRGRDLKQTKQNGEDSDGHKEVAVPSEVRVASRVPLEQLHEVVVLAVEAIRRQRGLLQSVVQANIEMCRPFGGGSQAARLELRLPTLAV